MDLKTIAVRVALLVLPPVCKILNALLLRRKTTPQPTDTVLVYSPNIAGHRHIYASKIIDFYLSQNLKVHFAYCGFAVTDRGQHFFSEKTSPYLEHYRNNLNVVFRKLPNIHESSINELKLIVSLQKEIIPRCTLFVDGDELIPVFTRQLIPGQPKLLGNSCAVFIMSEFYHLRNSIHRNLRKNREKQKHLMRLLFHMVVFKYFNILDMALHSDECFVKAMQSGKIVHVPEIGHKRGGPETNPQKKEFYSNLTRQYQAFLAQHSEKEVLLLFGDLEMRKGFDFLARLAAENEDLVLVRVGRTKRGYTPSWDITFNKEKLIFEGRIFELDSYIDSQEFMDTLFGSIDFLLLPYKHYHRTSSVMIQALSYGKPLLVTNTGLMGYRVRTNKIGLVFKNLDYDDFVAKFQELKAGLAAFEANIRDYYAREFSQEAFDHSFLTTINIQRNI